MLLSVLSCIVGCGAWCRIAAGSAEVGFVCALKTAARMTRAAAPRYITGFIFFCRTPLGSRAFLCNSGSGCMVVPAMVGSFICPPLPSSTAERLTLAREFHSLLAQLYVAG